MRKFWAWLGYQSGRRAGLVSLGGLLVTLLLGLGVTQLHFKTGTDSYLNKSDQAYKDDVRYEDLFGGQAVAVMFTMPKGHDVSELLTAENLAKFDSLEQHLQTSADGKRLVFTVITPSRVLEYSNALIGGPAATNGYHPPDLGSVSTSVVGSALLAAQSADPSPKGQAARAAIIAGSRQARIAASFVQHLAQVAHAGPRIVHRIIDVPASVGYAFERAGQNLHAAHGTRIRGHSIGAAARFLLVD